MAPYPLMLFSSFANIASVKTDKRESKLRPDSFHRDLLSVPQENNNADNKRKTRRCVRSIMQGGKEREIEMKEGDGLKSEKQ